MNATPATLGVAWASVTNLRSAQRIVNLHRPETPPRLGLESATNGL